MGIAGNWAMESICLGNHWHLLYDLETWGSEPIPLISILYANHRAGSGEEEKKTEALQPPIFFEKMKEK